MATEPLFREQERPQRSRPAADDGGPLFSEAVGRDGYLWWYIDALSDDGQRGLTIIAFIGSVFSPYYASARRRAGGAGADPMQHCAINVALYDGVGARAATLPTATVPYGHWWAMTERASRHVRIDASSFVVGPSRLTWRDGRLTIDIDEIAVPSLRKVRGQVIVEPDALFHDAYNLDAGGRHQWRPIAPSARARVTMQSPGASWTGTAYMDSNTGSAPLESAFTTWDWSRGKINAGASTHQAREPTLVIYDVRRTDGTNMVLAKRFDVSPAGMGSVSDFPAPPPTSLPHTGWRVARATACDAGACASVVETLEDTPFYSRSIVSTTINGREVVSFHESLSLNRFSKRWVQTLLPFKMPRRR